MDLKRSMIFCEQTSYDTLKRLLLNVSLEYKSTIGYYQGMNYIAMFLLEAFGDELKAYHFFCYIAEKILNKYLSNNFEGIVKLLWVCDKLMQIHSPSLWQKLRHGGVSSIHFSVPNIITLFTSLIKNPDAKKHIYEIWDIMLCDGLSSIIKALIYILEIQKVHIDMIESEELLIAMRNVENDPFAILKHSETDPVIIQGYIDHLRKFNLRRAALNPKLYEDLLMYYTETVSEIYNFWSKSNPS